ncbi:MAG: hypothetical protein ACLP50_18490 [Solirubrobacteraceae bacterium]
MKNAIGFPLPAAAPKGLVGSLDGPSKTIRVEPLQTPVPAPRRVEPEPVREPAPREPERPREPAR